MALDLDTLSERIDALAALSRQLRGDNHGLRLQLTERDAEIARLREALESSRLRVLSLLEKLPAAPQASSEDSDGSV